MGLLGQNGSCGYMKENLNWVFLYVFQFFVSSDFLAADWVAIDVGVCSGFGFVYGVVCRDLKYTSPKMARVAAKITIKIMCAKPWRADIH